MPLDRFSSDAVLPDSLGKLWLGANGDWIATVGSPWNWELVNVYTRRRIPLPSICGFEPTLKKLEFAANGHLLCVLKIVVAYLCFICASPGSTASTHSYKMKIPRIQRSLLQRLIHK
jgi:hypothetical protein